MGSRQEDKAWSPSRAGPEVAGVPRDCLVSQGVTGISRGWLGQEHSADDGGHASPYLEHFNLLQHELLCLHVIPGEHNDLLHGAPICKTP